MAMPLHFTIRDLLWLTLVVALASRWWLKRKSGMEWFWIGWHEAERANETLGSPVTQ